jgi:hypothetical protein
MVIDPHFEFGDSDEDLAQGSVGTRIVRLAVIERERFSHAEVWIGGRMAWEMSFEGELDERPVVGGRFPYDIDQLARAISPAGLHDHETCYRVPIAAVERLVGWRRDLSDGQVDQPRFAQLVYPRPVGVAAEVARDLGGAVP